MSQQIPNDTLRPASLASFVGQEKLKNVLSIAIAGANARKEGVRHSLFVGPPGLGKTTLANIIAQETGKKLVTCSGTSITKIPSLATVLNQIDDNTVLFVDEIHRLPRPVEEALYTVMEDFRLDVTTDKLHINMRLPRFSFVGATTRQGLVTKPLQDRFGATYHLDFYSIDELTQVIKRSASISGLVIADGAASELARRAKRTPRIANNLLLQSRDFALSYGIEQINHAVVLGMMDALEIDSIGLTRMDLTILDILAREQRPLGLDTIGAILAEERDVIERVYEPYLLQAHLIERTVKGRVLTEEGYKHLGKISPKNDQLVDEPIKENNI